MMSGYNTAVSQVGIRLWIGGEKGGHEGEIIYFYRVGREREDRSIHVIITVPKSTQEVRLFFISLLSWDN